jgi:competence protein ComEA
VADAVAAAGGALPGVDLSTINLARPLADGEQVLVGVAGGGGGTAGSADPGADPSTAPLDLNAASLVQLEALPGVGPVLAQKILDWRSAHGRFSNVNELREVGGIGDKKFGDIAPKVRV